MTVYGFQSKSVANRLAASVGGTEVGDGLNAFGQNWLFLIPAGGIPGMTGTTPGTADCVPYFIKTDGTLTEWTNNAGASVAVPVFNVSEAKATEGLYMPGFMVGNQAVINPAGITAEQICASLCACNNLTSIDPAICDVLDPGTLRVTISGFYGACENIDIFGDGSEFCAPFDYSALNGEYEVSHPDTCDSPGSLQCSKSWAVTCRRGNAFDAGWSDITVTVQLATNGSGAWDFSIDSIDGVVQGDSGTGDAEGTYNIDPTPLSPQGYACNKDYEAECEGSRYFPTATYEHKADTWTAVAAALSATARTSSSSSPQPVRSFGDKFFYENPGLKTCGCLRDVVPVLNRRGVDTKDGTLDTVAATIANKSKKYNKQQVRKMLDDFIESEKQ